MVIVVGSPLQIGHLLFNCAVIINRGRILGVVPKTYLPNYREFYEARQFNPATSAIEDEIDLCGQHHVPFGNDLVFIADEQPLLAFHAEICEDLWVPIPPSSRAALAGATVLLNLSASKSPSARPVIVTTWSRASRRDAWRRTSIRLPAPVNRPPTSPGMATPLSMRTATWSESHVASRTNLSWCVPKSTSSASARNG